MAITLTFRWVDLDGRLVATSDGEGPLACLLMDDGGLGLEITLEWIDIGLSRIDAVLTGAASAGDWDREDWGVSFGVADAIIRSMYVKSCSETIATPALKRALSAWREFVVPHPSAIEAVTVEI